MPRSEGQKLKLLYILRMLQEYSDEAHPLGTAEIIRRLEAEGIHAERKSIYSDIAALIDFGYDILPVSSRRGGGYYLAGREFELAELKLLVDAVQSSRFITTRKSRELIARLERQASRYEAGQLKRQVYVAGRIKTENESIYYNVDAIHRGIQENRQISFQYLDWNLKKELVPRTREFRRVSPWALLWREENYYLAAYDDADGIIKHFRVDKMGKVELLEEERRGHETFDSLDLTAYTNQTFGMFAGDEESVTLQFSNRLTGVVLDRFGKEITLRAVDGEHFQVRVKVAVSGQFFGWMAGIGKEARIVGPASVKERYRVWLSELIDTGDSASQ